MTELAWLLAASSLCPLTIDWVSSAGWRIPNLAKSRRLEYRVTMDCWIRSRLCDGYSTTFAPSAGYAPWGTIDGHLLLRQLVDVFDRGEQAPVPLLAGFNSGEIRSLRILAPPPPATASEYETTIHERYLDLADEFLRLYPS